MSAGLDSLGSVEFANVLGQKLGIAMPGTLVFDYPTASAVTAYLSAQMLKAATGGCLCLRACLPPTLQQRRRCACTKSNGTSMYFDTLAPSFSVQCCVLLMQ
jgi:hypothetical protein